MKVVFFFRNPESGYFSLEGLFRDIIQAMPPTVEGIKAVSKFRSRGVFPRIFNIVEAALRQGDVNHITGDIHFVSYFLRKRKTLLTVLDCRFLNHSSWIKRVLMKLLWLVIPEKRVGLISVISEATRLEVLNATGCDPDKVRVVPCCVSPVFQPALHEFNSAKPRILQVGTKDNKNLFRLIEALHGVSCHLHVIGELDQEQKDRLTKFQIEYSNSWNLSSEDVVREYVKCDLLSFVSTYEGFGMPIMEANAVGRAVITSSISPMLEVAEDAACLVDPLDVESIRSGVLHVIQSREYREQLVRNGFRNVQRFTPDAVAKMYLELYKELLVTNR